MFPARHNRRNREAGDFLMKIKLKLVGLALLLTAVSGCEAFDRFEAWKMEALFGEPNPYNAQPVYAQPAYGQPVYYAQPMQAAPAYLPGQPVPPGYVQVVPQGAQPGVTVAPPMVPAVPTLAQPAQPTPAQALLPPAN